MLTIKATFNFNRSVDEEEEGALYPDLLIRLRNAESKDMVLLRVVGGDPITLKKRVVADKNGARIRVIAGRKGVGARGARVRGRLIVKQVGPGARISIKERGLDLRALAGRAELTVQQGDLTASDSMSVKRKGFKR